MNNKAFAIGILLVAAAVFWANQPDRWHVDREFAREAHCEMIELAMRAVVEDGALQGQTGYGDLDRRLRSDEYINLHTRWLYEHSASCENVEVWYRWRHPDRLKPNTGGLNAEDEHIARLSFGPSEVRPWRRKATLNVSFFCGNLCGQFWEFEFAREGSDWVLSDITHTGMS